MKKMDFTKSLACLFYAIAASDKRVHEKEVAAFEKVIRSSWSDSPIITNRGHTDQHYQVEKEFHKLVEKKSDPQRCFDDFVNFMTTNNEIFPDNIRKLIWKAANSIAIALSGMNKSELILLTKLKMILQQ
jgi:hypothetical protein